MRSNKANFSSRQLFKSQWNLNAMQTTCWGCCSLKKSMLKCAKTGSNMIKIEVIFWPETKQPMFWRTWWKKKSRTWVFVSLQCQVPRTKKSMVSFWSKKFQPIWLFSAFIDYCDVDGDGSISFFEFIIMTIRKELEQQGVKMSRSDVVKHTCSFMQSDHTNPKVLVEFFFRLIKTLFLLFLSKKKSWTTI